MKVLIRADASSEIGSGHIVRTWTLARVLRGYGADVSFACRPNIGNMIASLENDRFTVFSLPPARTEFLAGGTYGAWVGAPQDEDARQTIEAIGDETFEWIIADHYGLDARWETIMRSIARRVMAIDDLANREHDCDLLLDQNYAQAPLERYGGLVPAACTNLLGPEFALLKPEYAETQRSMSARRAEIERVMVFFGGGSTSEAVDLAMAALSVPRLANLHIDLVVSPNADVGAFHAKWPRKGKTEIHRNLPHLAGLMAKADLAIGAGGATTWERMCMGLPSIVVSTAENQQPACQALARDGLIWYLGPIERVSAQDLAACVRTFSFRLDDARQMADHGMKLVDGLGATRVAQALLISKV